MPSIESSTLVILEAVIFSSNASSGIDENPFSNPAFPLRCSLLQSEAGLPEQIVLNYQTYRILPSTFRKH